jgi:hypothetical protein
MKSEAQSAYCPKINAGGESVTGCAYRLGEDVCSIDSKKCDVFHGDSGAGEKVIENTIATECLATGAIVVVTINENTGEITGNNCPKAEYNQNGRFCLLDSGGENLPPCTIDLNPIYQEKINF